MHEHEWPLEAYTLAHQQVGLVHPYSAGETQLTKTAGTELNSSLALLVQVEEVGSLPFRRKGAAMEIPAPSCLQQRMRPAAALQPGEHGLWTVPAHCLRMSVILVMLQCVR